MQNLRHRRGQSLVETAIALPILLVMTAGVAQFGFIYFVRASVDNAAREGARYGSLHSGDPVGSAAAVRATVMGVDPASLTIDVTCPDAGGCVVPNRVRVDVTYPLATFWLFPASGDYVTSASMRIERHDTVS